MFLADTADDWPRFTHLVIHLATCLVTHIVTHLFTVRSHIFRSFEDSPQRSELHPYHFDSSIF